MFAAISRTDRSASARREISSLDRSRAWIRRELWIAIAAWWASASARPTWSGPKASISPLPTWSTPSRSSSAISGVITSERIPSSLTA